MGGCRHQTLALLVGEKKRLRCRRCYLTIAVDELGPGYCPECYEVRGQRRYDFEELQVSRPDRVRYRCDDCGVTIVAGGEGRGGSD